MILPTKEPRKDAVDILTIRELFVLVVDQESYIKK